MPHRSIQIGLSKQAVALYVNDWIQSIEDITEHAAGMQQLVKSGDLDKAEQMLPQEQVYPLNHELATKVEAST